MISCLVQCLPGATFATAHYRGTAARVCTSPKEVPQSSKGLNSQVSEPSVASLQSYIKLQIWTQSYIKIGTLGSGMGPSRFNGICSLEYSCLLKKNTEFHEADS